MTIVTITDRAASDESVLDGAWARLWHGVRAAITALRCRLNGTSAKADGRATVDDDLLRAQQSFAREEAALRALGWDGTRPRLSGRTYLAASGFVVLAGTLFAAFGLSADTSHTHVPRDQGGAMETASIVLGLLVHVAWLGHHAGRGIAAMAGSRGRGSNVLAVIASTAQAVLIASATLSLFGPASTAATVATALGVFALSFLRHRPGPYLTDRIDWLHRDALLLEARRDALRGRLEGERAQLERRIARIDTPPSDGFAILVSKTSRPAP